jgi:hypothetical protein
VVLVFGQHHREFFQSRGWSKDDIRAFLYPLLTAPHTRGEGQGFHVFGGPTESSFSGLASPDNIVIVAAGGSQPPLTWVLYPHFATALSTPVTRRYEPELRLVPEYQEFHGHVVARGIQE